MIIVAALHSIVTGLAVFAVCWWRLERDAMGRLWLVPRVNEKT